MNTRRFRWPASARCWATLLVLLAGLLGLMLGPAAVGASGDAPAKWPAWYAGHEVTILMGPGGNSADSHQVPDGCLGGLGPDFSTTRRSATTARFYGLFVTGATQMLCADGSFAHDMVLSTAPGGAGYNAAIEVWGCVAGPAFRPADMPFRSAAAVETAIDDGRLACGLSGVLLSPVVRIW